MSFADDTRVFAEKMDVRLRGVFVGSVLGVNDSVVHGSPTTGAPGQPVDTGALRASWQVTFPTDLVGEIATNVEYAPAVEDGVGPHGPMTLKSQVGGFHSVKLTRAAFDRVVEDATRTVVR